MDYYSNMPYNRVNNVSSYSPKRIDDNQKHTIKIIVESECRTCRRHMKLIVDNMGGQKIYLNSDYLNNPSGNIFIGGLNRFPFNGKYRNGFYGCIHSMTVSYVS